MVNNNQLFRKTPPKDICLKILAAFGLKDFTDTRNFSRKDHKFIIGGKSKTFYKKDYSKLVVFALRYMPEYSYIQSVVEITFE